MTRGTCNFVSTAAAERYYLPYLGDPVFTGGEPLHQVRIPKRRTPKSKQQRVRELVQEKITSGEIVIGPPKLAPGETLKVNREEGRYFIQEPKK